MAHMTYPTWTLRSLMPAVGWQAAYIQDDGTHQVNAIHALALADLQEHLTLEGERVGHRRPSREPLVVVVGVEYSPTDDWTVCDEASNYCGLLPPGMSLAAFEAAHRCAARRRQPRPA